MASDYPPTAPFDPSRWHGLPAGSATCSVRSFSPSELSLPIKWCIHPSTDGSNRHPVLTSLIKHEPTDKIALFDLGLSKVWQSFEKPHELPEFDMFDVAVEADLDEVLEEGGIKAADVDLLVLSHNHFDHTGNPALFPNAKVIVGPSELQHIKALEDQHDRVTELSWHYSPTHIAAFDHSYDVFSDGSFLLVSAPGHTEGHLAALVRTSPPSPSFPQGEYVLLAADCAHHPAFFSHRTEDAQYTLGRWREPGEPLDHPPKHSNYDDFQLASATLEKVKYCNQREEIMVVLAHDFEQWGRWGGGKDGWGVELNGWRKRGLKG